MFWAANAQAAGFALYEWGARGNGMAGALVATQNPDASTVAYNPAAMSYMDERSIMAGATAIAPSAKVVVNGSPWNTQREVWVPPHAYYVEPLSEGVRLGIGSYCRFGLGNSYNEDWTGRSSLYRVAFQTQSLGTNLSFKHTDNFSTSIGLELMGGTMDIDRNNAALGEIKMSNHGVTVGGNLSMLYRFNEEWSAGFIYRTPMKFVGDGDVKVQNPIPGVAQSGNLSISAMLPDSYTLGVNYKPLENLNFEADIIHTQWSTYNKLSFDFGPETSMVDSNSWKQWRNVWRFQLGGEWWATDWFALRGGYVYDQEPIRSGYEDYMLPANDRQMYCTGVGFKWDEYTLDFSYQYLVMKERDGIVISGDNVKFEDGKTHLFGMSIGYTF